MSISRNTKTVKLLLKLFDKENNALSVVDLVSILSQEMNKTTVYRILQRLEEAGIDPVLFGLTDDDKPEFLPIPQEDVRRALFFRTFWIVLHIVTCFAIIAGNGRTLGIW